MTVFWILPINPSTDGEKDGLVLVADISPGFKHERHMSGVISWDVDPPIDIMEDTLEICIDAHLLYHGLYIQINVPLFSMYQ
jgi:hypothetical protein